MSSPEPSTTPPDQSASRAETSQAASQQSGYNEWHDPADLARYRSLDDQDPFWAYLRDRRIKTGVDLALRLAGAAPEQWDVLVTCGGAGGEGSYLANRGFKSVTVADLSDKALEICRLRDPRLQTLVADGEKLPLPDRSYDMVLVRDGLHHLPRPPLGLTEMLRVARRAVVVMEPHTGLAAKAMGTVWERHGEALNYVFRWDRTMFEQCVFSYLLQDNYAIRVLQVWDHNVIMRRLGKYLGSGRLALLGAKALYATLETLTGKAGNNMVAVVVKEPLEGGDCSLKGRETSFH